MYNYVTRKLPNLSTGTVTLTSEKQEKCTYTACLPTGILKRYVLNAAFLRLLHITCVRLA